MWCRVTIISTLRQIFLFKLYPDFILDKIALFQSPEKSNAP